MAVLNSWQRIDRVISGRPFGSGFDGAYSSATIPTMQVKTCSGAAASTTLSADTDASPFIVGDVLLLIQSRGTGVGQWEINKVDAVGADQYTMNKALKYTYTDSGASQAQAVKILQYSTVTVGGTWTVPNWDGNINGIFAIAVKGTISGANNIVCDYGGFIKGPKVTNQDDDGWQGEGSAGASSQNNTAANGNGGGAGIQVGDNFEGGGAGGGGNGAAGTNGTDNGGSEAGVAGAADGSADLTDCVFGGAGGSGAAAHNNGANGGGGGDGGGLIFIFAKDYTVTGFLYNRGENGENAENPGAGGGGGGGAGGSTLIVCETATLGTNLLVNTAGSGGNAYSGVNLPVGGAGGTGRIAVHHSRTVTGTTNPAFNDQTDTSLVESSGLFALL